MKSITATLCVLSTLLLFTTSIPTPNQLKLVKCDGKTDLPIKNLIVQMTPFPPKIDQELHIKIQGTTSMAIEKGTRITIESNFLSAPLSYVPIVKEYDACMDLKVACPVKPVDGRIEFTATAPTLDSQLNYTIPFYGKASLLAVGVKMNVQIKAHDWSGKNMIMCAKLAEPFGYSA